MNAQQVWQAQEIEAPRVSLAYVRHRASSLERRIRRGNAMEYTLAVLGCCFWIYNAWQVYSSKPLAQIGLGCFVLFALYGIYRQHRYAAAELSPLDAGVLETLRYQRRQFERQRDWARGAWRWWLPAVSPGIAFTMASMYLEEDPVPWRAMGSLVLVMGVGMGVAAWWSELRARRLQREIDALDSLGDVS
jgi:hypothetical protein